MNASFALFTSVGCAGVAINACVGCTLALARNTAIVGSTFQAIVTATAIVFTPVEARYGRHTSQTWIIGMRRSIGYACS